MIKDGHVYCDAEWCSASIPEGELKSEVDGRRWFIEDGKHYCCVADCPSHRSVPCGFCHGMGYGNPPG